MYVCMFVCMYEHPPLFQGQKEIDACVSDLGDSYICMYVCMYVYIHM